MTDRNLQLNKCSDESIHRPVNTFLMEVEGDLTCSRYGDLIPSESYALQGNDRVFSILCCVNNGWVIPRPGTFTNFLYQQAKSTRR